MNEYTVTFTAEVTAVFKDLPEALEHLCSESFVEEAQDVILYAEPAHNDVHVRDVKVFISKEDV
jgi:hypothetical protein